MNNTLRHSSVTRMAGSSKPELDVPVMVIQRYYRGYLARKATHHLRIQHEASRRAALLRRASRVQQTLIASEKARSRLEGLDGAEFLQVWKSRYSAAVIVQKYYRGWHTRQQSTMHDCMKQRRQAAVVIQKHVRGFQARQNRAEGKNQGGAKDSGSRSPSPTGMLKLNVEYGMLTVGPERERVLLAEIEERLQKTKVESKGEKAPSLDRIVAQSQENSRAVPKALDRAERVKKKCDHLLHTLQTRLELPAYDAQDPEKYPRPPPGSRREKLANLAHAMSMSDVVDVTDMSDIEAQRWDAAMHNICQASFVWPWRDRDDSYDKVCKLRWELLTKSEQARLERCENEATLNHT